MQLLYGNYTRPQVLYTALITKPINKLIFVQVYSLYVRYAVGPCIYWNNLQVKN